MSDLEKYMIEKGFVEVEPGEFYFKPEPIKVLDTVCQMSALVLSKVPDVPSMFFINETSATIRRKDQLDEILNDRNLV